MQSRKSGEARNHTLTVDPCRSLKMCLPRRSGEGPRAATRTTRPTGHASSQLSHEPTVPPRQPLVRTALGDLRGSLRDLARAQEQGRRPDRQSGAAPIV
eukprot:scaffold25853_cov83-Phaeocystis_antarctica.AAC.1